MQVHAKIDLDQAFKAVRGKFNDQVPFAAQQALNKLAFQIAVGQGGTGELRTQIDKYLEGGAERFTKQGFQYIKATKKNLTAIVIADLGGGKASTRGEYTPVSSSGRKRRYLENIIEGGTILPPDKPGRKRLMQPTKNTPRGAINNHGNIRKDAYQKRRKDDKRYFYGIPRGFPKSDNLFGLWERRNRSAKRPYGTKLRQVFSLGYSSRQQRRLFPATQIAERYARKRIMFEFNKELKKAERSRRPR